MLVAMRRLIITAVVSTVLVVTAAPAHAQQDLIESDPAVIRARAAVESAQAAAHAAAAALAKTSEELVATQAAIEEHAARVAELDRQQEELRIQRDALKADLRGRAISLYRSGGNPTIFEALSTRNAVLTARRKELSDIAARKTLDTARKLSEARDQLAKIRTTVHEEENALREQKAELDTLSARQVQQQGTLARRVATANTLLAQARAIGALRVAGEPVMGRSTLSAAQMAAWYNTQGFHPRLETSVAQLAQIYLDEGADENLRGDFAFAQAILETGGFAVAPANNFSGIGWCDTCSTGNQFPTPRDGVRAQVQLLVNYADAGSRAALLHHRVSQYLYGSDPVVAVRRFDTFYAKGWAPTWRDMGHGNWATDPNYANKVITIYRKMVTFSQGA